MFVFLKRIIRLMLEFYRRMWQVFLLAFPAIAATAAIFKDIPILFYSFLTLAFVCFIIALVGLYYDYQDARKKPIPKDQNDFWESTA